jgi:hypothetical protein
MLLELAVTLDPTTDSFTGASASVDDRFCVYSVAEQLFDCGTTCRDSALQHAMPRFRLSASQGLLLSAAGQTD